MNKQKLIEKIEDYRSKESKQIKLIIEKVLNTGLNLEMAAINKDLTKSLHDICEQLELLDSCILIGHNALIREIENMPRKRYCRHSNENGTTIHVNNNNTITCDICGETFTPIEHKLEMRELDKLDIKDIIHSTIVYGYFNMTKKEIKKLYDLLDKNDLSSDDKFYIINEFNIKRSLFH